MIPGPVGHGSHILTCRKNQTQCVCQPAQHVAVPSPRQGEPAPQTRRERPAVPSQPPATPPPKPSPTPDFSPTRRGLSAASRVQSSCSGISALSQRTQLLFGIAAPCLHAATAGSEGYLQHQDNPEAGPEQHLPEAPPSHSDPRTRPPPSHTHPKTRLPMKSVTHNQYQEAIKASLHQWQDERMPRAPT